MDRAVVITHIKPICIVFQENSETTPSHFLAEGFCGIYLQIHVRSFVFVSHMMDGHLIGEIPEH